MIALVVAIRGAITVEENSRKAILAGAAELFRALMEENDLSEEELISIIFTVTPDLSAAFPAEAVRQLGFTATPLMCAQEINVPGSLPYCIRVLVHCQGDISKNEVHHIYLREAKKLRPDLERGESL